MSSLCAPLATADFTGRVLGALDATRSKPCITDTLIASASEASTTLRKANHTATTPSTPPMTSPSKKKSRSRRMATTSTIAPLETCSYRMERTSLTRWMIKRCSLQDEHAVCLQLNRRGNVLDQQIKQQVRHVEATLAEQGRIDPDMCLKRRRA